MKLFFTPQDFEKNQRKIAEKGSPLDKIEKIIPWEKFRKILETSIRKGKLPAKAPGGRPAYDSILMFKILVLQRVYNISDEQTEYQILDRWSFQKFLGLELGESVPDEKTIWLFKNQLAQEETDKQLFEEFNSLLNGNNLILKEGVILDASFIEKPRQHFSKDEKEALDKGNIPSLWKEPDKQPMVRQKDTDAKWTKKHGKSYFGYKDHVKVDEKSKLIMDYEVTSAEVHDSQLFKTLISKKDANSSVLADSAYVGLEYEIHAFINNVEYDVHEKAFKNSPLTEDQKQRNKERSKKRARVEHVFAFMENSMNKMYLRTIGLTRTKFSIGMMNLVYNFFRFGQLQRA